MIVTDLVVYGGIGYVVGAFTPAVGRKIKALFVKESKTAVSQAETAVSTAVKKTL